MDNLSELDDCINTLEQLQLTLDLETPTVKRNPKVVSSPLSQRFIASTPFSPKCINSSPLSLSPLDSVNKFDFAPQLTSLSSTTSTKINDTDRFDKKIPDLKQFSLSKRNEQNYILDEDQLYSINLQQENLDLQSVSVRRTKLMSNLSGESDLFSVPEVDTTDFPPPPPPLNVDSDNYLKTYSPQPVHRQQSSPRPPSPITSNNPGFHTIPRKLSANSMKINMKPLHDPYVSSISGPPYTNNVHSESSSQSNLSNYTDKEPSILNSYSAIDSVVEREDPSKQTIVRFFTTDKTTKAIAVTEKMTVEQIIKILMEKHFWIPSLKSAVVEKVPSLKMERFLEENEILLSCINSWPATCGNMIFFEPREDIYGLFHNSKLYLGENFSSGSINVDIIKDLFCNLTAEQHEYQDYLYIKKPGENSWKRKFCLLNHHGVFSIQKKKSKSTCPSTIMTFNDNLYLYTSTGGWTKLWDAPTPFGFAFKSYGVVDPKSDQIMMFCAGDEVSMRRWCSNLRLCKYKTQVLNNYQQMQNRSIYCSNLFSSSSTMNRHMSMSPFATLKTPKYHFSSRNSLPTSSLQCPKSGSSKFKF